ncbi:MAG: AAA family ATPase [Mycobacterium sp.]|nr:AAA family ATPase [Mycobacterium sp.]
MADNTRARRLDNLTNAKAYNKAGLYLFPSSGKTPLIPLFQKSDTEITPEEREEAIEKYEAKHGELPVHVGATRDPDVIKKMFKAYPDCVWSISCGPSKLVVIDADSKANGPELIGKHFAEHGLPEGCVVVPTQSGGQHYIFSDPDGTYGNSAGVLKPKYGCDVRGKGGQYISPGSIRQDGKTYGTRKDMLAFLRAYMQGTLPKLPDHVAELIGTKPVNAKADATDADLTPVVNELESEDWPDQVDLFEPGIGIYDLDELRRDQPEFAELYDSPSGDRSTDRWAVAQLLLQQWRMPVTHLAVFYEMWEGAGTQTEDGKGSGNYNLRDIAREWYKNKDRYVSKGAALAPVLDIYDGDAEMEAYSKKIERERKGERGDPEEVEREVAERAALGDVYYFGDAARLYDKTDYIIENLCAPGQLGVLYGASNTGKTFAVIHMGDCVVEGRPWFGHNVEKSGALYLFAEGKSQFNNRLVAYRKKYPSNSKGMVIHKGIPSLVEKKGIPALRAAIKQANKMQTENGLPPIRIVFIDTFAKAVAGAEENSAKEMQPIMNRIREVAEETGVCIIVVHHTGKDKTAGARGSYAIFADADFELEMFDHPTAKKKKMKAGHQA